MVIASRPDVALNVAFNADPNDPAAVPAWSDLTAMFLGADGVDRGRQYELDQTRGAQPTLRFVDRNEYLNADNPSSLYAPNLVPYRPVIWQAMWPNTTVGNLLNTGYGANPGLKTTNGYDPTFESYALSAVPPWIAVVGGTNPTVNNITPHGGTQALFWTVVGTATVQGVSLLIPCIPGRQYTCSAFVRQTTASTQQISVVGVATGTSTATTAAYVRLTVTFTATQPMHTLQIATTGTAVAGAVVLDDIQHEQAAAASVFTTTGPVIYTVMNDLVERWPSRWDPDSQGFLGLCDATCVDAFAALQATDLSTEVANSILAKKPAYYWKLNEPQGATVFAESSGNGGPSLVRTDAATGAADAFTTGVNTGIAGDPGGVGIETQTAGTAFVNSPTTVVQAGLNGAGIALGANVAPYSYTVVMWAARDLSVAGDDGRTLLLMTDHTGKFNAVAGSNFQQRWQVFPSFSQFSINGGHVGLQVTDSWGDGKPHLYVAVNSVTSINATVTLYVDGVNVGTNTGTLFPGFDVQMDLVEVAGAIFPTTRSAVPGPQHGIYGHCALWNRALTAGEITDLTNAGKGYKGETSGARISRYLGYSYIGPTVVDAGQSVMGVSVLADSTAALDACQAVTITENGVFWVDGDGNLTFAARTRRYLTTTPTYIFGENTAGGELPYEGDVEFGLDPTLLYNDVQVTNAGGIVAHTTDAASQRRFFKQSYPRDVNLASDLEALDAANYLLNQHKIARVRVSTLTLNPGPNPALWPAVLGIEVGTRVTVKRRSKAANNGAGLTQSRDFFVEQISHSGIDFEAGTWTTTLQLSPVDYSQVWILGDATYGVLDTTTVLGY